MKRLWAPWRKTYIRPKRRTSKSCLFCRVARERKDDKNLIVTRGSSCFAILNLYPYNNGHVMIVPNRHVASLELLSQEEKLDWLALAEQVMASLRSTMKAQGFNVGANLGRIAGAGIPKHLHLHIVPRWQGDHNFLPVVAETKVISESLKSSFGLLKKSLSKKSGGRAR